MESEIGEPNLSARKENYEVAKLIFPLVLGLAGICMAEVIYVDAGSPNDPGTGTAGDPYRWIKDAIDRDAANDGDIIVIRPGIYMGQKNRDLDPDSLSITIRSTDPNDPAIVAATIIDPQENGRAFYFHSGEGPDCMVMGLTIRNARSVIGAYGGSIYCYESSPTIRSCIIRNAHATDSGGGVYCDSSSPRIIDCTITGNSAEYYGGGISCNYSSNPEIIGSVISGNNAGYEGGGIDCVGSNPAITNCIITNNEAGDGGGINCYSPGEVGLVNCTIVKNSAAGIGGGIYCQSGGSSSIKNSILWANEATQGGHIYLYDNSSASVDYCNVQGDQSYVFVETGSTLTWKSLTNIDIDPNFVSFDPGGDADLWDFHLQSTAGRWDGGIQDWVSDSTTSPCIDMGDPTCDWSGEPWPNGKRTNMGAYGGTVQASKNGNIADFNVDGKVNFIDFAQMAGWWNKDTAGIENLNGDGIVNIGDLDILAVNWMWKK